MNTVEPRELLQAGEGAKVEFKRDNVGPDQVANEIANTNGGRVLFGVADNDTTSRIKRPAGVADGCRRRGLGHAAAQPLFEATEGYSRVVLNRGAP